MGHKHKRFTGHYCWMCECHRPNERFSGKGHRRHICRECAALGPAARAYKRNVLALERCVTWEGFIPWKRRATLEGFLQHEDPRLRALAEQLQQRDAELRETLRADREAEDLAIELAVAMAMAHVGDTYERYGGYDAGENGDPDDDEIPF